MSGMNRSGFLVIAYVAQHLNTDVIQAARFVNERRVIVVQNPSFRKQLVEWGRERGYLPGDGGLTRIF